MAQARIPAPGLSPPYSLSRFLFGVSLNAVMFYGGVLAVPASWLLLHTAVGSCCVPGLWVSFHCTSFPLHAFCPGSGRNSRRNLLLCPICNLLLVALSHG